MSRSHIYETIQTVDPVSLTVRVIPGASVALSTAQTLWSAEVGGTALPNPMIADTRGVIEAWTDQPERIPYTASLSGFVSVAGLIESQRDDAEDAAVNHTHAESDIPSLVNDLANKSSVGHVHAEGDISNLAGDLASKAAAVHSHAEGDITGLASDLGGKAAIIHTHTEGDITDAALTPAVNKIPISDANGKLDGWISTATTTAAGKVQLAADGVTTAGLAVQASDSRLALVSGKLDATSGTATSITVSDFSNLTNQGSDPASPSAGVHRLYAKSGGIYIKDSAGTVVGPLGTGGGASGSGVVASATFTAPLAGEYFIAPKIEVAQSYTAIEVYLSGGTSADVNISKNGTNLLGTDFHVTTTASWQSSSVSGSVAVGDTLILKVTAQVGNPPDVVIVLK